MDISGINQKLKDFVPDAVNEDTQFGFEKLLNNANPIKAFLDIAASKLIDTNSEKLGLRIELAEGFTGTFTQTNLATRSGSAGDGKTYVEVFDAAAPGMPTGRGGMTTPSPWVGGRFLSDLGVFSI